MPNNIDLNDMMLFMAVVDAGSFTLAAERLHMPKANLSRKVSRLEQQLGVTLLERTTRSQNITEAGKHYLGYCREIKQQTELAEASVAQILNKVEGPLKVGTSVGIGHEVLKPVLAEFMHQHPDISLQLNLLNRRVDLIEESFDMVIRIGSLDDSRLMAKNLGSIQRKLYVSPSYLAKWGQINDLQQLSQATFLLMSSVQSGKLLLIAGRERYEFTPKGKMQVDDFLILKQMAVEGVGVAIIPDYMCQQEVADGRLIQLLPEWGMERVDAYAVYPKHRLKIPKVNAFMTFIQKVFADKIGTS